MKTSKEVGVKTYGSKFVRVFQNEDGSPVRRKRPRERMSKKERRRARKEGKDGGAE